MGYKEFNITRHLPFTLYENGKPIMTLNPDGPYEIRHVILISRTDFNTLYAIEESCATDPTPVLTREDLVRDMTVETAVNFFLYYKDKIVGYGTLHDEWDKWYMSNLAVAKDHRKQGWGKRLVEARLEYIKKQHRGSRIYVHIGAANRCVIAMYEKFGFKKVGPFIYDTGENGVELEKWIGEKL